MYKQKIEEILKDIVFRERSSRKNAFDAFLSIPKNSDHGDYTTNIALQLAKQVSDVSYQSSDEIAKKIVKKFKGLDFLEKVEIANGFINFFVKPKSLMQSLHNVCDYSSLVNPEVEMEGIQKRKILVEYASFNALKPVHIGHLRNIILGESVSRLLESVGNEVFKVTYTSDIGLPVAKTIWGIKELNSEFKIVKEVDNLRKKAEFLGKAYAKGATAYDEEEKAKEEIANLNKDIYARSSKIIPLYQQIIRWSLDYFDTIYQKMGTKFDEEFLESEVEGPGKQLVLENVDKVFRKDQGAIIFPGVEFGLHNRVFISAVGNPTYEAKDMALAKIQYETYNFDLCLHVVANEQDEYFKVIFKALEQLEPDIAKKERHLSYGIVNLSTGKMSSRTGNVVTLEFIYDETKQKVADIMKQSPASKEIKDEEREQIIDIVSIGAIKFAILKYSPQTNITFDLEKSVSLQGDSGPYVQYTYARAKSVLRSAQYDYQPTEITGPLEDEERELLRKIEHFDSVVSDAAENYAPNALTNYLLDFAKAFNLFYQKHPIIKGDKSELRLALTCAVAVVLKQGLNLLGIDSPERM